MSVLLGIWKVQGFKLITVFTCGPASEGYVLSSTVSMHEPKALIPVAIPPMDESVKLIALFEKERAVGTFVSAALNTPPLANVKD